MPTDVTGTSVGVREKRGPWTWRRRWRRRVVEILVRGSGAQGPELRPSRNAVRRRRRRSSVVDAVVLTARGTPIMIIKLVFFVAFRCAASKRCSRPSRRIDERGRQAGRRPSITHQVY
jgi:hypothetical protein